MESVGPLLVKRGLLSEGRLREALKLRESTGLPIQDVLVEHGFLKEDELVRVYRRDMMFPEIMRHDLENITPEIRDLVPAEMAIDFRIIPVRLDLHGHLVLAMANPADNHAADELVSRTRLYVVRCVAAKSLIHEFLDKLYGDNAEEIVLLTKVIRPRPTLRPDIDNKTMDTDDERDEDREFGKDPVEASKNVISLTKIKKSRSLPANDWKDHSDFETQEKFAVSEGKGSKKKASERKPKKKTTFSKTPTLTGIPPVTVKPGPIKTRKTSKAPAFPFGPKRSAGFESAVGALEQVSSKNEVGKILCDYMNLFCKGVVFFVIRRGFLSGREMRGSLNPKTSIQQLHLPLNEVSTLKETVDSRVPYRGNPGNQGSDRLLQGALGYTPGIIVVFPINLRNKVVALLYGDRLSPEFDSLELNELLIYAERAYERLLLAKKQSKS